MEKPDQYLWQAKLGAWLHDPAEKSLILMRTRNGHEGGTVARLRELCFGSDKLASDIERICRLADRWAAAADCPQWPRPNLADEVQATVRQWVKDQAIAAAE